VGVKTAAETDVVAGLVAVGAAVVALEDLEDLEGMVALAEEKGLVEAGSARFALGSRGSRFLWRKQTIRSHCHHLHTFHC